MNLKVFLILCVCAGVVDGKPALQGKAGPCADAADPMACMHGLLMHGDDHVGDTHKTEDDYLRFKPLLQTGKQREHGPKDAEQTFHAALMHNNEDGAHAHTTAQAQPQKLEEFGPKDAEKTMHGVLMHGDKEIGHDHTKQHAKSKGVPDHRNTHPLDAESLMHGDSKFEKHHVHEDTKDTSMVNEQLPVNLEKKMHEMMHNENDVLEHTLHEEETVTREPIRDGPIDQETLMHVLMHNGEEFIHNVVGIPPDNKEIGPLPDDLHGVLMHGDNELGHDHGKEDSENKNKPFQFNVQEILKLDIDEDVLKSVGLDKIPKQDETDYRKWKENGGEKKNDDTSWGESLAFISDTIVSDIELMKRRYMNFGEDVQNEINENALKREKHLGSLRELEHSDADNHENDDISHDLELIGRTDPINSRHKVFLENTKK